MSNPLKDLVSEINETPAKKTYLDATSDTEALELFEKEVN